MTISARQQVIYDYIVSEVLIYGRPPTYRDIADHIGVSGLEAVKHHLDKLRSAGLVTTDKCGSRCLRVIKWPAIDLSDYGPGTVAHAIAEASQ